MKDEKISLKRFNERPSEQQRKSRCLGNCILRFSKAKLENNLRNRNFVRFYRDELARLNFN